MGRRRESWLTDSWPSSAFIRCRSHRSQRSGSSQRLPSRAPVALSPPDHPIIVNFFAPPPMSDPRFARLKTDPRFRKIKKNDHKVAVDERFKSIFQDDKKSKNKKPKGSVCSFSAPLGYRGYLKT